MKVDRIDTDYTVCVIRCFTQIGTCFLHTPVKRFVTTLNNLHAPCQRNTLYLKSVIGNKRCFKLKFRMKSVSPYLPTAVVQASTCFTSAFDKDLRSVQQKDIAEGRTGPNSCLPLLLELLCCFHEELILSIFTALNEQC